jgi:2-dehydro-3-deoxyphosphogluconate aldolase/(4S)-4-hydroxy-2-oxoglutarate aldolase
MLVGAGSVLTKEALGQAVEAGARFGVAPCLDQEVVNHARSMNIPFVPGIATPSELYSALKSGCVIIKIFPAVELGGVNFIKSIAAPFKMMSFHLMPTGGINDKNLTEFLGAERVIACGATFIVDSRLVDAGDYNGIEDRIKKVKDLCG